MRLIAKGDGGDGGDGESGDISLASPRDLIQFMGSSDEYLKNKLATAANWIDLQHKQTERERDWLRYWERKQSKRDQVKNGQISETNWKQNSNGN